MSRKADSTTPKIDRRVRRTRDALGDALLALIQEKPFDAITVQEVLDRADIGRSTFYAHYRDKDDLFLSDLEEFFEKMSTLLLRYKDASNRVAPVRELFAHVAEMRQLHSALIASGKMRDFQEMGQEYFARAIEQRLADLPASRPMSPAQRAAMAHAFAGALLSLLSWWIHHGATPSPDEMDKLFHQMVGVISKARIVDALRRDGNGYVQPEMVRSFEVAKGSDSLAEAFRKLGSRGLSMIPVVDSGRLVGIVTMQNLMHSMALLAESRRLKRAEEESD
jgi:AcrR family transcriptional regulator